MTTVNVIIEVLEIIILVPIFITFTILFYKSATSVLEFNKVASGMFSVCLSALIVVGMKKYMIGAVLLPGSVLGAVFFLLPIGSFIAHYQKDKAKKYKNRWSRYAAKDYWKGRLKIALCKILKSIWDMFTL